MDLPGSFDATHGSPLAWALPFVAIALLLVPRRFDRRVGAAWVIAALLASVCYVDFGRFRYGSYLNEWDVFHYYLGAEYLEEVGYEGLYEAALVADAEGHRRYRNPDHRIRDLATTRFVDVDTVLARREAIRARFTDERWRAFVADVGYFSASLPGPRFSILLEDRGFHGTPVWAAFVRSVVTHPFGIRSPIGRFLMLAIDPLLIALATITVLRTYGLRTAALLVVLLGTHYLLSWGHLKGALLRTDFALAVVFAICAMRTGRPALAGASLAWATISRVFPALFVVGPAAVLLSGYVRTRRWDRGLVRFFAAYGGTLALATCVAALLLPDLGLFPAWLAKIARHATDPVSVNIGYRTLVDANFVDGVPEYLHIEPLLADDPDLRTERGLALGAIYVAVLVPALAFASRLREDRAIAFGFVFVFFLVSYAYYYALVLLPFLLFFAADDTVPLARTGIAALLLSGALGYLFFAGVPQLASFPPLRGYHQEFGTYYYASWCIGLTTLLALASAAIEARRRETLGP